MTTCRSDVEEKTLCFATRGVKLVRITEGGTFSKLQTNCHSMCLASLQMLASGYAWRTQRTQHILRGEVNDIVAQEMALKRVIRNSE